MSKKVLISAPYMIKERAKVEKYLETYDFDVDWADVEERLEAQDLLKIIGRYDGVVCGDDRFSPEVYDAAKNLKAVVKWGTGIDSLNAAYAETKGIRVRRTTDAFTMPVADSTLGLILAFCRNLVGNDRVLKTGGWNKPQGYAVFEKSFGIIGFGNIGQAVAQRLQPFQPKQVLAYDPTDKGDAYAKFGVIRANLDDVLAESDFILLHADLNESSHHILDKGAFDKMRQKPFVINTARGPLIDEHALIQALETKQIQGAGLDVFEHEPLPANSPLRSSDQVLLSSHNTNSSPTSWDRVHLNSLKMLSEELK